MGDYTSIRFDAELSEWGKVQLQIFLEDADWHRTSLPPSWKTQPRARFIPLGVVQSCPRDWVDDQELDNEGLFGKNSVEGSVWSVVCSVKDDGVVNAFLTDCLPRLIRSTVRVETYYELDSDIKVHNVEPK